MGTKPPSLLNLKWKMQRTLLSRRWCFTKNNYGAGWVEYLELLLSTDVICYAVVGREVAPETGTPHLQGYIEFKPPMRKRMVSLKRMFKETPLEGAHWSAAKGSAAENETYCSKEDEEVFRVGSAVGQGSRVDLGGLLELVQNGASDTEMAVAYPHAHARFMTWTTKMRQRFRHERAMVTLKERMEGAVKREWQERLLTVLEEQPERKVTWVWEVTGGVGKSWLARYLVATKGAFLSTGGKHTDTIYAYLQAEMPGWVIFDLARDQEERVPYTLMEHMKNGMLTNTKYMSQNMMFEIPKLLVIANFEPVQEKLSEDRWDIHHINQI